MSNQRASRWKAADGREVRTPPGAWPLSRKQAAAMLGVPVSEVRPLRRPPVPDISAPSREGRL